MHHHCSTVYPIIHIKHSDTMREYSENNNKKKIHTRMKGTTELCVEVHVERVQGEPGGYALLWPMKASNKAHT